MDLRRKRAYDTPSTEDGFRVLVDRLWPRGLSKQNAEIDLWAKDVTPTAELRREWHAAPASDFEIYAARYRAQLAALVRERAARARGRAARASGRHARLRRA